MATGDFVFVTLTPPLAIRALPEKITGNVDGPQREGDGRQGYGLAQGSASSSAARPSQRGRSARIRNAAAPTTTTLAAQIPTSQESFFTMAQ